jgi:flavin-dependent dehydrogenase
MDNFESCVLVIGGGPAGLSAAIALRLRDFDVTVVDASRAPVDKACGEGILPAGVAALRRLGVRIPDGDGFPLRGIRFLSRGASVEAPFPSGPGLALRRTRLHQLLADRASQLGIRLIWNTPWNSPATCVDPIPAPWMVGADGQRSSVRRAASLDPASHAPHRFGFRRHYRLSPWTDFVEVHWGFDSQVFVTPVSADEIGVAVLSRDPHRRLDPALVEFPDLRRKLRGAAQAGVERGAVTVSRRLKHVVRGRTALIGDASGSVDAITGEGLGLAFQQALALANAMASGDLRSYESAHRRLLRRPACVATLLLWLDRRPSVRRALFHLLAAQPPIFARLLAGVHSPAG